MDELTAQTGNEDINLTRPGILHYGQRFAPSS